MRWPYLIALLSACLLLATAASGRSEEVNPSSSEFTLHKGLSYSSADPSLTLDLFLPNDGPKPAPCVMVIQGGGFRAQNGQRFRPFAEHLARHGFAAALIAYRGQPDDTYKVTISDVRTAVRFVRSVSEKYAIDPERIGAMGRSAGGTLTVLLAVGEGVQGFEEKGEHGEFSSRIQAAVAIAGVYDFVARFTDEEQKAIQPKLKSKWASNGNWIGSAFAPTDEHWIRASAINHVDATDPPILLLHSKDDGTVPWMQSRDMYAMMIKAGIAAEVELADDGGHGGPKNTNDLMVAFFKKVLVKQEK